MSLRLSRFRAAMGDLAVIAALASITFAMYGSPWLTLIAMPIIAHLYFLIAHRFWRQSLGKWETGLVLAGNGCLMCRELRKLWPLYGFLAAGCFTLLMPNLFAPPDPYWPDSLRFGLILIGILGCIANVALTALPGPQYWDQQTGFHIQPRIRPSF